MFLSEKPLEHKESILVFLKISSQSYEKLNLRTNRRQDLVLSGIIQVSMTYLYGKVILDMDCDEFVFSSFLLIFASEIACTGRWYARRTTLTTTLVG